MSDLVGNPEDRFYHNETHMFYKRIPSKFDISNGISVSKLDVEKFAIFYKPCMAKHTNPL